MTALEPEAGKLSSLVKALEAARAQGELTTALKIAEELEAGSTGLTAEGLKLIRELAVEAARRLSTGGDAAALIDEALSVAKALQELEALTEKGAQTVSLEDLEAEGNVEGKPVYTLKPRKRPEG